MKKNKYTIQNLSCVNCAYKLEEELRKNERINDVKIDFATATIQYESDLSLNEINALIENIESGVKVVSEEISDKKEYRLSIILFAVILGLIGNLLEGNIKIVFLGIAYFLLLKKIIFKAFMKIVNSHTIDENLLITVSVLGAAFLDKNMEAIMVVTLYIIGKILEERAVNKSRKSIKELMDIKEPCANKKDGQKIVKVPAESLKVKDVIVVRKGEKVPVDGKIIKGSTFLDMSSITGEEDNYKKGINDEVLSGSINVGNVIEVEVVNKYSDSTVAKILELLDKADEKKAKLETFVYKYSKFYTPIILGIAILMFLVLLLCNLEFKECIYRALSFLVISCPCAIVISVPLAYVTSNFAASRKGILVKGSNYLDNLNNVKRIIFDKTGTLTNGNAKIKSIDISDKNYAKSEIIEMLVKGESLSTHPIAEAFMKLSNGVINNYDVDNFKEIVGKGISYEIDNKKILVGSRRFCKCDIGQGLHMHIDGKHVASIYVEDGIKINAIETIENLKKRNITTFMFTGDREKNAMEIGKKLGIENIKYELLPNDKFQCYEDVSKGEGLTIFVGDGVNDAPTLKRADIGISMGGVGSEASIESSDIVLMNDDISKIPLSLDIASFTRRIILENLIFAIGVKIVVLILSFLGIGSMFLAVFADTGVTLITIVNTLRIIKKFKS